MANQKLLLVNIATGNARASQLSQLQDLQSRLGDSLVVIAFPSNSFANENRSDADIKTFCETTHHTTFLLARKASVTGTGAQPVFQWLAHQSENGAADVEIKGDYQKFLIDSEGNLVGIFSPMIPPNDPKLIATIRQSK